MVSWRNACSRLITLTRPEAAKVWPTLVLVEVNAQWPGRLPRNASLSALISTGSPNCVPVPWVTMYSTASVSIPARW